MHITYDVDPSSYMIYVYSYMWYGHIYISDMDTYIYVMWIIRMSHKSCVMSRVNESRHIRDMTHLFACPINHIRRRIHVTYSTSSSSGVLLGCPHANKILTSRVHECYNHESCHMWMSHVTCEWVMSHVNESCHMWMSNGTLWPAAAVVGSGRVCTPENEWVTARVNASRRMW